MITPQSATAELARVVNSAREMYGDRPPWSTVVQLTLETATALLGLLPDRKLTLVCEELPNEWSGKHFSTMPPHVLLEYRLSFREVPGSARQFSVHPGFKAQVNWPDSFACLKRSHAHKLLDDLLKRGEST